MPPRRSNRQRKPPVTLPPGDPNDEEVFSVHSIEDSSTSPPEQIRTTRASNRLRSSSKRKFSPEIITEEVIPRKKNTKKAKKEPSPPPAEIALTISDDSTPPQSPLLNGVQEEDHDELLLEDVEIPTQNVQNKLEIQNGNEDDQGEEEELELEDVQIENVEQEDEEGMEGLDHTTAYNDAYQAANANSGTDGETQTETVVFKDGKGQPNGISISLGASRKSSGTGTPRKAALVTPRDRMVRLATHKWTVLSLIAHARARNGPQPAFSLFYRSLASVDPSGARKSLAFESEFPLNRYTTAYRRTRIFSWRSRQSAQYLLCPNLSTKTTDRPRSSGHTPVSFR